MQLRQLVFAMLVALPTAVLAQGTPPTDAEVTSSHAACDKHVASMKVVGKAGIMPLMEKTYSPGWESCTAIEAEYKQRQILQKEQEQQDLERLNSLAKRLSK